MAGRKRRRGGGRRRRHNGPYKQKEDMLYMDGEVVEALPNTMFLVRADNGMAVLTTVCGKMRRNRIRVTLGDRVCIEVSPYDVQRGRITIRHRVASRQATPPRHRHANGPTTGANRVGASPAAPGDARDQVASP